jgi:4-hydroxy-3-polyprenylbenzoate decarboxylase
MIMTPQTPLLLAITGATGLRAAEILMDRSPWPVWLIASEWGKKVFAHERGDFQVFSKKATVSFADDDLSAPVASGSVPTAGMIILPCSANTLGEIAAGLGRTLIARAAHCHLKERRPMVCCLRESPLTLINLKNAARVAAAGGTIMPLSPPFYMFGKKDPRTITLDDLLAVYVDRVLSTLGREAPTTWADVR